jgi:hypothetical protein
MTTTVFSPEQIAALSAPLDRAKVKQREQGRAKVSYLEGWIAIRFRDTVREPGPRQGHAQHPKSNDHQHHQGARRYANRRSGH